LEEAITKFFDGLAKAPPPTPQGADSPADLALRGKETDVKLQIAREADAVKMAQLGLQTHIETTKLATSENEARTKASLEAQKEAGEERFRQTRAQNLESKAASHLT
jgi:hypothetical protein